MTIECTVRWRVANLVHVKKKKERKCRSVVGRESCNYDIVVLVRSPPQMDAQGDFRICFSEFAASRAEDLKFVELSWNHWTDFSHNLISFVCTPCSDSVWVDSRVPQPVIGFYPRSIKRFILFQLHSKQRPELWSQQSPVIITTEPL